MRITSHPKDRTIRLAHDETVSCAPICRFLTQTKQQNYYSVLKTLVKVMKAAMKCELQPLCKGIGLHLPHLLSSPILTESFMTP